MVNCADDDARADGVREAAAAVRRGGLVVLPTDTVYGLGADAFAPAAVAALLAAKGRGRDMPPPVLVPDRRTVDGLAIDLPDGVRSLVDAFWPGALTVVCWAQSSLSWDLGDTGGTVAVRMPDDAVALELLAATGPLAVSSANVSGQPPAATATGARDQLGDAVDVYLDAGGRPGGEPSTIVDATREPLRVLRQGAVSLARLREVAPSIIGADGEVPEPLPGPPPPQEERDPPKVDLVKPEPGQPPG
jgi:tRNA threonylcarbamoyl adenosine modification protein (Sua5/YciO/YrdC/YwlC family)